MRGLMAIVVLVTALAAAIIVLAIMTVAPQLARAADRPSGRMQACTAQWLDLKAGGHPPAYKSFIRECLAGRTAAPVPAKAVPARAGAVKAQSRKAARVEPKAVKLKSSVKKPSRMSVCAAQWRQKKADDTTAGQTYRQFSSQCLKAR